MVGTDFGRSVTGFLTTYLVGERGMSDRTVKSYGRTIRSLVRYLDTACGVKPDGATLSDFTAERVRGFLEGVEESGCGPSTRNQRLAAIKSFARYAMREEPSFMLEGQRMLAIPSKKVPQRGVEYLEQDALAAMLAAPDQSTAAGRRDLAVMATLYDSGARVQELIDVLVGDARLDLLPCITLSGKGGKVRTVPIMSSTAAHITRHLDDRGLPGDGSRASMHLFCSPGRSCYTRPGIAKMLDRNLQRAKAANPGIAFPARIHPHMMRASKAIHMLDAGANIIAIRDFLGHVSVSTTQVYLRASIKAKSDAVTASSSLLDMPPAPDWRNDSGLMDFLDGICS